jgi:sugar/nucleoside kinase (ribokinase family)
MTTQSIDRIGAGDAYLSLSSLALAAGTSLLHAGFLGTLAASMSIQMIGNSGPVGYAPLIKYLTRMLK